MVVQDDLTYKVIGCCLKVHNTLGNACLPVRQGFQEVIYQPCLAIELNKAQLNFAREIEQTIFYDGQKVGKRRADFIVENKVIIELKAVIRLQDVHLAQAKNYLVAYNFDIGLLINFGSLSLEYKRIYHPRLRKNHQDGPD
jgi:GxxExxY protein